jgi:hypothetical protein
MSSMYDITPSILEDSSSISETTLLVTDKSNIPSDKEPLLTYVKASTTSDKSTTTSDKSTTTSDKSTTTSGLDHICEYTYNQNKRMFIKMVIDELTPILYDSKKIIEYLQRLQPTTVWEDANLWGIYKPHDVFIAGNPNSYKITTSAQYNMEREKLLWIREAFHHKVRNTSGHRIISDIFVVSYDMRRYSCWSDCW